MLLVTLAPFQASKSTLTIQSNHKVKENRAISMYENKMKRKGIENRSIQSSFLIMGVLLSFCSSLHLDGSMSADTLTSLLTVKGSYAQRITNYEVSQLAMKTCEICERGNTPFVTIPVVGKRRDQLQ